MSLKCVSCGKLVEIAWNVCPYCGASIVKPTSEQAKDAARLLRSFGESLTAEPDLSPDGKVEIRSYISFVSTLLSKYSKLLIALVDLNQVADNNPNVLYEKDWLGDKQSWKMNVKIILLALGITARGELDPENPKGGQIPSAPQGCTWIGVQLVRLNSSTDELIKFYEKAIASESSSIFQEAEALILGLRKTLIEASNAIDIVMEKVDS